MQMIPQWSFVILDESSSTPTPARVFAQPFVNEVGQPFVNDKGQPFVIPYTPPVMLKVLGADSSAKALSTGNSYIGI